MLLLLLCSGHWFLPAIKKSSFAKTKKEKRGSTFVCDVMDCFVDLSREKEEEEKKEEKTVGNALATIVNGHTRKSP